MLGVLVVGVLVVGVLVTGVSAAGLVATKSAAAHQLGPCPRRRRARLREEAHSRGSSWTAELDVVPGGGQTGADAGSLAPWVLVVGAAYPESWFSRPTVGRPLGAPSPTHSEDRAARCNRPVNTRRCSRSSGGSRISNSKPKAATHTAS
ncbi:hypothetical protein AHOG_20410 [Actinoalloteichus hoggarensis]|uniref:Uncharacterized protein n=1 Tax=Actinoalloteichus hoggarensis TaxID=1470176 RepID=A0A221W847_9PSEU|nr:hypothetical protein AHOG_20410 [Actinoalloteichus hoggarensis]